MKLNSFDEWSQLKEVIVGSAKNYTSHERELSFELFFLDNLEKTEWLYPRLEKATKESAGNMQSKTLSIKQRYVDELNEDIEGIASALKDLGVKVLRPMDVHPETSEVTTPAWSASVVPPLNVRDIALILGDEIIETSPMIRSRYFETQYLKPIFQEYFKEGAKWNIMPRPWMTDRSFDLSYANFSAGGPTEPVKSPQPSYHDVGHEMMFDGAQCVRLGKDIIANVSTENHAMAVDWLERHFGDKFNFHRVYRMSDSHIDSMLLALRPGTFLVRSKEVAEFLPPQFRNWELIEAPMPKTNNFPQYEDSDLVLTSPYIDLNVLSVNEETVLVNEACPELIKKLEQHKFTVVPVRHRHRRLFGGGFHCFTLDTVRSGGMEDYLS